jgi:CRP-like cAMP-binding protein
LGVATDLFLLVGGQIELISYLHEANNGEDGTKRTGSTYHSSIGDSEMHRSRSGSISRIGPGDFINEISFFTSTPQIDTVVISKAQTISRADYKMISDDHPGTAMKILRNLLTKVEIFATSLIMNSASVCQNLCLCYRLDPSLTCPRKAMIPSAET